MSIQQNLTAIQNNDLLFQVLITYGNGPLDLTGYTPPAGLKASATTPDGSGVTFGIGTGLTYTGEQYGRFSWTIPHADTATAGTSWYRIDIDNGSTVTTALYGTFTLTAA